MALDIRLDFIQKINPAYIETMKLVRDAFISADKMMQSYADDAQARNLPAAARTIALARTFNEQACQSAIKSLCILGEVIA